MASVSDNSQKGNTSPPTVYSGFLEHLWASALELAPSCLLENQCNPRFLDSLTLKSYEEPELCASVSFTRILALFLWKRWSKLQCQNCLRNWTKVWNLWGNKLQCGCPFLSARACLFLVMLFHLCFNMYLSATQKMLWDVSPSPCQLLNVKR